MATIEIDWDVFKEITARRDTEGTTPNDVLRSVFGLPPLEAGEPLRAEEGWSYSGVFFPDGTEFRAYYGGKWHAAKVTDGALMLNGEQVYSPSEAAQKVTNHARNGWWFWECRLPGQTAWRTVNELRTKARAS